MRRSGKFVSARAEVLGVIDENKKITIKITHI